jgi:hypothetical protein
MDWKEEMPALIREFTSKGSNHTVDPKRAQGVSERQGVHVGTIENAGAESSRTETPPPIQKPRLRRKSGVNQRESAFGRIASGIGQGSTVNEFSKGSQACREKQTQKRREREARQAEFKRGRLLQEATSITTVIFRGDKFETSKFAKYPPKFCGSISIAG